MIRDSATLAALLDTVARFVRERLVPNESLVEETDAGPPPGVTPALANAQFYLANIGLPGMLLGSVFPVGLGLDRIGILFGFMEAAAGVLFALHLKRALRAAATLRA